MIKGNILLFLAFAHFTVMSCKVIKKTQANKGETAEVVSYIIGDSADITTNTQAGLLLLGGSSDVNEAFAWQLNRSGGGDIVVLRASGGDGYNSYLYNLAKVHSVETLIIDSREKANLPAIAQKIRNAEALFIAGGDQWNYVNYWKNSPVQVAINYLLNIKKVTVGGTSAGLAILGGAYFSAEYDTVTSEEALANPFSNNITLGANDFLKAPFMQNIITDSHYTQRNRQGRHIVFMARLQQNMGNFKLKGIGIDEQTALCIDETGIGRVFGKNSVYFLQSNNTKPELCQPNEPLSWVNNNKAITVNKLGANEAKKESFNAIDWVFDGGEQYHYFVNKGVLQKH